jgi:hypothetical protein
MKEWERVEEKEERMKETKNWREHWKEFRFWNDHIDPNKTCPHGIGSGSWVSVWDPVYYSKLCQACS